MMQKDTKEPLADFSGLIVCRDGSSQLFLFEEEDRKAATGKGIVACSQAVPHGLGQISREGFRSAPSVGIMRTSRLETDSGQLTHHACIQPVHVAYVG